MHGQTIPTLVRDAHDVTTNVYAKREFYDGWHAT